MGLNKATGDMYNWVNFTHTHLRGQCPHACHYCYARRGRAQRHYQGELRLKEDQLKVPYNKQGVYFIEHMMDLFADGVPDVFVTMILFHCQQFPENDYVFQSRNVPRMLTRLSNLAATMKFIIGTTAETNRSCDCVNFAPSTMNRLEWMGKRPKDMRGYVTVEPIIDFNMDIFSQAIIDARPDFVNIGADSKGCGLNEPAKEKIFELSGILLRSGIPVRFKNNLDRIVYPGAYKFFKDLKRGIRNGNERLP